MTELRTNTYNQEDTYAEYETNGTTYGVTSTTTDTTETFYLSQYNGTTWTNFETPIFTLNEADQTALVRLDLTIKNDTTYIFYSTYNTKTDTTTFYTKTSPVGTTNWTDLTDTTLNNEIVPDLEFGYDPYVADNGYIYVSYATSEEPKSYKLRCYNGTTWDYVVNSTVNTETEEVTYISGSIYNNNVYVAYSYIDNTNKSGLYVKVANNGTWETVYTADNVGNNTVVDFTFNYTNNTLGLDYSIAKIENYTTDINTQNYN